MSQIANINCYKRPSITTDILPNEILLEIFYITSCHLPSHFIRMKPSEAIAVAAVCSRWRQLALRYPLMWTNIYIPTYHLCHAELFFIRSQSAEVDITFDTTQPNGQIIYSDRYLRVSKLIKENAGRIRSLLVRTSALKELRDFFQLYEHDVVTAPILQKLEVIVKSTETGMWGIDTNRPIFDNTPSLRYLRINEVPLEYLPPFGINLSHFDMDESDEYDSATSTLKKFQGLFCSCPNLTSLVIRRYRGLPSLTSTSHRSFFQRIEAPRLKYLAISFHYLHNSQWVGDCMCPVTNLITPSLQYLELSNLPAILSLHVFEHLSRFAQSCNDASCLTVRLNCAVLTDHLISFLQDLPQFTSLELINVTTDALHQVLLMSNFSKISLDLNSITVSTWGEIFPKSGVDVTASVILHVPLSSSCNPYLLKATSIHKKISVTSSSLREGLIGVNSSLFFASDDDLWDYE
ncbi:hypothetical protein BDQ17DRAFT_1359713 [Cyathus striatus]|nr:hypothetical protein BDQ17DRAFT_1359713 [Cyathus striatus]